MVLPANKGFVFFPLCLKSQSPDPNLGQNPDQSQGPNLLLSMLGLTLQAFP